MSTAALIREKLSSLAPTQLEIQDESSQHLGHEGAKSGGGHYWLMIVSEQFIGKATLARHRLIYQALGPLMQQEIHALSIQAYAPEEV